MIPQGSEIFGGLKIIVQTPNVASEIHQEG